MNVFYALSLVSLILAVLGVAGAVWAVVNQKYGLAGMATLAFASMVSLFTLFLHFAVPEHPKGFEGFLGGVGDWSFIIGGVSWLVAFVLLQWFVVEAAGTKHTLHLFGGIETPTPSAGAPADAPAPVAQKQTGLAGFLQVLALLSLGAGITLITLFFMEFPNPSLERLTRLAMSVDPNGSRWDARMEDEDRFGLTLKAEEIGPADLDQHKKDTLAYCQGIPGNTITDVKIVRVRLESDPTKKHIERAVVHFQRMDPAEPTKTLPGTKGVILDHILTEEDTSQWAGDVMDYILAQRSFRRDGSPASPSIFSSSGRGRLTTTPRPIPIFDVPD